MAAAGEMIEPKFIHIVSEEVFTKQNNKIKALYEKLRTYDDGEESIKYLPFRLYESYEQYKSEQEEANNILRIKYEKGEQPHYVKGEIEAS